MSRKGPEVGLEMLDFVEGKYKIKNSEGFDRIPQRVLVEGAEELW